MAAFPFELVAPDRLIFAGAVDAVIVPGTEGEFTMLENHAPLLTSLRPGVVEVDEASRRTRLFVSGGFADVSPKGLTILADEAIPVEELDGAKMDLTVQRAEAGLAAAQGDEGRRLAREKLDHLNELRAVLAI